MTRQALKGEAKQRQGTRTDLQPNITQQIEQCESRNERSTAAQIAKTVNTNRQYVSDAIKMKKAAPEKEKGIVSGVQRLSSYRPYQIFALVPGIIDCHADRIEFDVIRFVIRDSVRYVMGRVQPQIGLIGPQEDRHPWMKM